MTDGSYVFDETPFCGYPESVSVLDLPSFVVHNEDSSDFLIPQTSDLGLIGEYTASIKSAISVPDDFSKASFTEWADAYEFKIFVEPCRIDAYEAVLVAGPITYRVGEPAVTDGAYSFLQTPACGYPESLTVTDLPAWVAHNEDAAEFTIAENGDVSLIGEHVATIKSEI